MCAGERARDCRFGVWARGAAHGKHGAHGRDTGGVPAGDVLVEACGPLQVVEELTHVGHARDAPAGDGAVLRGGRGRVRMVLLGRGLQVGIARDRVW